MLALMSIYCGFSVHEGCHVAIFNKELPYKKSVFAKITNVLSDSDSVTDSFMVCYNLVEDLYVHEFAKSNYPRLFPFLQILYDITIDEKKLDGFTPTVLPSLFIWRNPKVRGHDKFKELSSYIRLLEKIDINTSINDRILIAQDILDLLDKDKNDRKDDQNEVCTFNGQGDFISSQDIPANLLEQIEENYDNVYTGTKMPIEYTETDDKIVNDIPIIYEHVDNGVLNNLLSNSQLGETIDWLEDIDFVYDAKWKELTRRLTIKNQKKTMFDLPKKTGPDLLPNELYRFTTDSKVFGQRNRMKKGNIKPQIILLLDHSGSMKELTQTLIREVYSLTRSLLDRRFSVSIYAHTTKQKSCLVLGIFSNFKTITTGKLALGPALKELLKISKMDNVDGFAINYVGGKFLNSNQPKVLVVLSDGKPHGGDYSGESAIYHTKRQIKKLRNKGIKVFSVSLKKEVIEDNNVIYGANNNISASDIESQLHKLINILR